MSDHLKAIDTKEVENQRTTQDEVQLWRREKMTLPHTEKVKTIQELGKEVDTNNTQLVNDLMAVLQKSNLPIVKDLQQFLNTNAPAEDDSNG
jgi:DNA integrity scanning protein DisA with diadenylate cyclase activity